MNRMPCRITDERVFNPWDQAGDDDREDRIDEIVTAYKTDYEMLCEFVQEHIDEIALQLKLALDDCVGNPTHESMDPARRQFFQNIEADMTTFFKPIAEEQDDNDNPPVDDDSHGDWLYEQSKDKGE